MLMEKDLQVLEAQWARKKYFSTVELARMFGVSTQTIAKWRKLGKLGFIKTPSGTVRYLRRHVEEFEARFEERAKAS